MTLPPALLQEFADAVLSSPDRARELSDGEPMLLDAAAYDHGETLLHAMVIEGRTSAVKLLIELGAAADLPDSSGDTPLMSVAKLANREAEFNSCAIAKLLLANGADPNAEGLETVGFYAVHSGNVELLQLLAAAEVDWDRAFDPSLMTFFLPEDQQLAAAVRKTLAGFGVQLE